MDMKPRSLKKSIINELIRLSFPSLQFLSCANTKDPFNSKIAKSFKVVWVENEASKVRRVTKDEYDPKYMLCTISTISNRYCERLSGLLTAVVANMSRFLLLFPKTVFELLIFIDWLGIHAPAEEKCAGVKPASRGLYWNGLSRRYAPVCGPPR